jgi:hypothetical protein
VLKNRFSWSLPYKTLVLCSLTFHHVKNYINPTKDVKNIRKKKINLQKKLPPKFYKLKKIAII